MIDAENDIKNESEISECRISYFSPVKHYG